MYVGSVVQLADTWGMHGDVGAGWWIVMVVGMAIFWGAVILGGIWLLRRAVDDGQRPREDSPIEILEQRFAAGELSVEEYRERREILAPTPGRSDHATSTGSPAARARPA